MAATGNFNGLKSRVAGDRGSLKPAWGHGQRAVQVVVSTSTVTN